MTMATKLRVALVAIGLALLCGDTALAQPLGCNEQSLPPSARALITTNFPNFHVVTISDLDSDERSEWRGSESTQCPGLLKGEFGRGFYGYAVSLKHESSNFQSIAALVFLQNEHGRYSLHVLSPSSDVTGHTLVISIGPPGKYHPVESKRVMQTHWPMIIYEAIGAGATGYYYAGQAWHSILLSE